MDTLQPYIPLVTAVVCTLFGWIIGRRKQKYETELLQIQSVEKTIGMWTGLTEELREECVALQNAQKLILQENRELREKIATLEGLLSAFKTENNKLINIINKVKKEYVASKSGLSDLSDTQ